MSDGKKVWAITGCNIPLKSTGSEPENTSRDVLCLLNTSDTDTEVHITIYYADREPSGSYDVELKAHRMRNIRFNDLIDPEAIPLATDFAAMIRSDIPIIVGSTRTDSSTGMIATSNMMAYPVN